MKNKNLRRKYVVVTLTPEFKVKNLIKGENSLDRAKLLVEKNKETLNKYGIPNSVFIRRVRRKNRNYIEKQKLLTK